MSNIPFHARLVVVYDDVWGMRAAHTYLLLRSLGYPDVRVLDDAIAVKGSARKRSLSL